VVLRKTLENPYFSHEVHILARLDITVIVYNLNEVLKILIFGSKQIGISFWFYPKRLFTTKTSEKSVFHPCDGHIISRLDVSVLYIYF
jgi:hypothetical protein